MRTAETTLKRHRRRRGESSVRASKVAWMVLHACILAILCVVLASCKERNREQIQIGALLPLTGSGANYGEYAKNGVGLAVDEINRSGGIQGKHLMVIYEDSQSNPAVGVSGYRKLLDANKVPAVLIEFSPVVMACAPIANEYKSVLLNCGAQTPQVREAGRYVLSAIPDAYEETAAMATFCLNTLHLTEVATFCINTETGVATTALFVQRYTSLGGKIIAQERHEQGGSDFKPQLTKLKAVAPPAIYMISLARESALILKQAAEIGLKTQWLSYASFQGEDILKVAKEAAEGAIYTYPKFDPTTSDRASAFDKAYFDKYSQHPEVYAATFYDGVYILKSAMEKKGFSGQEVRQGLSIGVYDGAAGPIDFRNSTWATKPLQFRIVKEGQFSIYK